MSEYSTIPIESPGINLVVVKFVNEMWKYLILRRAKGESYEGYWGFLTGCRSGDETVPQLAIRELREETGLKADKLFATEYTVQFYEPTVDRIWILPVLVAVVGAQAEPKLGEENDEFRWLLPNEAKILMDWQNLLETLENVSRELEGYPPANWVELPAM